MARFADYFVICGLDYGSGLEPDKYSGKVCFYSGKVSRVLLFAPSYKKVELIYVLVPCFLY